MLVLICLFSSAAEAGYQSSVRKWTHKGRIYRVTDLDTVLLWRAPYYSPEFRRSQAQKEIDLKFLDTVAAAQWVEAAEEKQQQGHEFFISIFTQKDFKDFSTGPSSFWDTVLTTADGTVLKPLRVEMVSVTPYERKLFPYLDMWSKAYRVTFPPEDLGKKFQLTLRSIEGKSTLRWKLH